MKKKKIYILVIAIFLIIATHMYLRNNHVYGWYTSVSCSNEPTFGNGDLIFANSFSSIERDKFVVFPSPEEKSVVWMFRAAGLEGDVLELKEGVLIRNGKKANDIRKESIKFPHVGPAKYCQRITDVLGENGCNEYACQYRSIGDSVLFNLNKEEIKRIKQKLPITLNKVDVSYYHDSNFKEEFRGKGWTVSDFGPITVPEGKIFVLGDNRFNAMDSRYIGYINVEDVLSVVTNY